MCGAGGRNEASAVTILALSFTLDISDRRGGSTFGRSGSLLFFSQAARTSRISLPIYPFISSPISFPISTPISLPISTLTGVAN